MKVKEKRKANLIQEVSSEWDGDDVGRLQENFFVAVERVELDAAAAVLAEDASRAALAVRADQHVLEDDALQGVDRFEHLVKRDPRDAVGDADERRVAEGGHLVLARPVGAVEAVDDRQNKSAKSWLWFSDLEKFIKTRVQAVSKQT